MTQKPPRNLSMRDCWLFAVASPKDLARRLTTKNFIFLATDLEKMASDGDNYKVFNHKAINREIQEPKSTLQRLHKRVHILLSRVEAPAYLHSAIKGRSYLSNARKHGADVPTVKVDVKKFFQSVPRVAVFDFFKNTMACRADVAGLLADLLTFNRHLPTGSSASPIISYYAFKPMFDELCELAEASGLVMTCYVDDITFSGAAASLDFLRRVRSVIAMHGLKSHKLRYLPAYKPKVITGVCITADGERVPNKLHQKIGEGFDALRAASTPEDKRKVSTPLLGRMEAARQIDPKFGARAKTLRAHMKGIYSNARSGRIAIKTQRPT